MNAMELHVLSDDHHKRRDGNGTAGATALPGAECGPLLAGEPLLRPDAIVIFAPRVERSVPHGELVADG